MGCLLVCAEALSNKCSTQYVCMLHCDPPPSFTVSFFPWPKVFHLSFSLQQSSRFTVLPIKAYIHSANHQWHDSFGQVHVPLISPLPFSIWKSQLRVRFQFNVKYKVSRLLLIALSHFTCKLCHGPTRGASLSVLYYYEMKNDIITHYCSSEPVPATAATIWSS